MNYDYLVDHAQKNVWCTPNQDHQAIIKPARLTPIGGAWNSCKVLWRHIDLPEIGPRFHVYQIGQIHPKLLALFDVWDRWVLMSDCCISQNLISDLYTAAGVQLPRFQTWYRLTRDKDLIIAVKKQPTIPVDFDHDALYLRLYANEYFHSAEADTENDFIDVRGKIIKNDTDIMAMQTAFNTAAARTLGHTYAFVNGLKVKNLSFATCQIGDVVEFVYDSSIYKTVNFTVADLPSFVSTLDAKHKYLLHTPGMGDRGIDYQDDVDVFLVQPQAGDKYQGVFFHKNQADAMRMVTHKDYAIAVPYVTGAASHRPGWSDVNQLQVQLHVRKSGYLRPLVYENQRIRELYKMADADIQGAMTGINATVPVWEAAALEASGYCAIMRAKLPDLNRAMVEAGYGYNAIAALLGGDMPIATQPVNGGQEIDVPYGLRLNSTAYEYDADGILLGWRRHITGSVYRASDPNCRLVEMISGRVSTLLDEVYGNDPVVLNAKTDYRIYRCALVGGIPDNQFEDVTDSGVYALVNGTLTWLHDKTKYYGLVRGNRIHLGYSVQVPIISGNLRLSLNSQQLRNGLQGNYVMQVPMGELDLFLNGHSLVEGVDYFVKFPQIVIVTKQYLVNPETDTQKITVRASGFCKPDFSRDVNTDTGFIKYGLMSHNRRFDIRDDKPIRIVVGGSLKRRADLLFSERDSGITVPTADNGAPYLVRDIVVPTRGATDVSTYELRAAAKVIDKQISDYLSLKLPEPQFDSPTPITGRYQLFSPFCCAIIQDLVNGVFVPPQLNTFMNDQNVFDACKPYEFWLQYDPTQEPNTLDDEFVVIHPHNLPTVLSLTAAQYRFVARVVKLYLHDKVSLSGAIQMT